MTLPPYLETREALEAGTLGAVVLASFIVAFASARDSKSWVNRATSRYIEGLRTELVSMFVFVDVRPVVAGQFLVVYLAVAAIIAGADTSLLFAVALVLVLPALVLGHMRKKRIASLEGQADAFVIALSSAMRSTPSIGDAFTSIAKVVSNPLRNEVELAVKHTRLGATFEEALLLMGRRINSRAFDTALTTVLIGQRLGGDVPSTLAKTGAAIREIHRLDRSARSRLSSAKTQLRIIGVVPILLPIVVERCFPGYFDALRTHPGGWIAVVVAIALWMAALFFGRRILAVML